MAQTAGTADLTATETGGNYRVTLPPDAYRVKFEAVKFVTVEIAAATVLESGTALMDRTLEATALTGGQTTPAPEQKPAEPSLKDLGFTPDQAAGSAEAQARLDKRSHMLKIHQRLGLITTAPLIATLILSSRAAGRNSTASGREIHAAVGGVTAGMYLTTASFAIFAPKVPGTTTRGICQRL